MFKPAPFQPMLMPRNPVAPVAYSRFALWQPRTIQRARPRPSSPPRARPRPTSPTWPSACAKPASGDYRYSMPVPARPVRLMRVVLNAVSAASTPSAACVMAPLSSNPL